MFATLKDSLKKFKECQSGNIMIIFALASIPVFGAVGAAVDYSRIYNIKANLQELTDAAALAGAGNSSNKDSVKISEAESFFHAGFNSHNNHSGYDSKLIDAAITPIVSVNDEVVTVTASYAVETSILKLLKIDTLTANVTSKASAVTGSPACIIALNSTAKDSFAFDGNSTLQAINCAVHANSNSTSALSASGRAAVLADGFCAVGSYSGDGFAPLPRSNCKPVSDPHEDLPVPSSDSCLGGEAAMDIKTTGVVLEPGTYCGGLNISSNAEVTMKPGVYIMKDGPFTARANSTVDATSGVTIYLDGDASMFTIISGAELSITAPATGTYAGFAFAQNKTTGIGLTSAIQGGGSLDITGIVYLPRQTLEVAGGGDVGLTSGYFAIVSDKVWVHGNGTVKAEVNHAAYGMPPSTMLTNIGAILVE